MAAMAGRVTGAWRTQIFQNGLSVCLPFCSGGEMLSLSSKMVCYTDILVKVLQKKSHLYLYLQYMQRHRENCLAAESRPLHLLLPPFWLLFLQPDAPGVVPVYTKVCVCCTLMLSEWNKTFTIFGSYDTTEQQYKVLCTLKYVTWQ